MGRDVELRELRIFLALADELHFGRTAERMGISQPGVSEAVRILESRLGVKVFDRTSRRVRLTPAGEGLRHSLVPALAAVDRALAQTSELSRAVRGLLRVGFVLTTEGPALSRLVAAFQARFPACEVRLQEVETFDAYRALRRGDVDVLCNWLAVDEPDLTAGTAFAHYQRALAVAPTHRFAGRHAVSIEDLADEEVPLLPPSTPRAVYDLLVPPRTPSGRPIRRTEPVQTINEILSLVARGRIVHPTSSTVPIFNRDDVVLVPIDDLPPLPLGLVWCVNRENPRIRALNDVAGALTEASGAPPRPALPVRPRQGWTGTGSLGTVASMGGEPDPPEGYLEEIGFHGSEDYPPKPRKGPAVWVAGFLAVVAGTAAILVVMVFPGGAAKTATTGRTATTGLVPAGGSPGQDATQVTTAFLHAWQRGDLGQAARYTTQPAAAQEALVAYQRYLHLRKLTVTVLTSTGQRGTAIAASGGAAETASYAVSATVALSDDPRSPSGTWRYTTSLVVGRPAGSQVWTIAWAPEVLAPGLAGPAYPVAVELFAGAVDASGTELAAYSDAGLTTIASDLKNQAQAQAQPGTPGLAVEFQTGTGDPVPGSEKILVPPRAGPGLATTIDGRAEAAARSAVSAHSDSAMVAVQPSTGKILAVANAGDNDGALLARVAPGSTMKVITSAALFNAGVLTASSGVACPRSYTVQGVTYHNANDEALPAGTPFITDFAQSCNNAFSTQWMHLSGLLASTAQTYFGLSRAWNIGIAGQSVSYFSAPADASGSELAEEAFGEGQLAASPLAMASVAATVDTGSFRQPYLLAGAPQVTATPLPASTDAQLQEMMRAVVTSGTAALVGFGPGTYAKTGTADVAGQAQPNSWLIAFVPAKDVAVACLIIDAGDGAQYAGHEVRAFLDSY